MSSHGKEVELTISSAKDIKNVNWRTGPNKPYVVVWVDPRNKCSTRVDEEGDTSPSWNETLIIPLPPDNSNDDVDDKLLVIHIVHAGQEEGTKPFIGAATLSLRDVLKKVGFGVPFEKTLKLKRSCGRPQGKIDVTVTVLEPRYHPAPRSYHDEHKPEKEKESKFGGMGTGLAIGAVAGVLGGLALSDAVEDNIVEEAAEKDDIADHSDSSDSSDDSD